MRDAPVHQIETCLHKGLQALPAKPGILRGQDAIVAVTDQGEVGDVTAVPNTTGMMDFLVSRNGSVKDAIHHTMDALHFPIRVHPAIVLSVISAQIMEAHRGFVDVYLSIN